MEPPSRTDGVSARRQSTNSRTATVAADNIPP